MRNYTATAMMLVVTITAAIGSYTVNLKVSGERAAVRKLERRLVADAHDLRMLQAELRTRARLPEMQRWNDNVLQMSAPSAAQYLPSPVHLASYGAAPVAPAATASPGVQFAVAGDAANAAPAPAATPAITRVQYTAAARAETRAETRPEPRSAPRVDTRPAAPMTARIVRANYASTTPRVFDATAPRAFEPAPRAVQALRRPARAPAIADTLVIPASAPPIDLLPEGGQ